MEALIVYPTKDQAKAVKAFLKALHVQFEKKQEVVPPHVLAGIKKGQESVKEGNTRTFLEFKKAINDATFSEYSKLLDSTGNEAMKNGLTPEILEALLASND
jgi:hypothetical protein